MKKGDVILLIVVLFIGIMGILAHAVLGKEAEHAVVTVDGSTYGIYPLNENREIKICNESGGENILLIKDGKADMIFADCPNQDCVQHASIAKANESIICIPNKVSVTITGQDKTEESQPDAYVY